VGETIAGADADTRPGDIGADGNDVWEVSEPGMAQRTLTDIPYPGEPGPMALRPSGRRSRKGAALAVAAVAVVASLAVWVLANASGSAGPQGQVPGSHASTKPGRSVTVDANTLVDQPVSAVVTHLRQLGLQVTVAWQPTHDQKPGRVLSVQPSGQVLAGSPVVVTAASRPHGDHHDHGHDHGDGNGQGGD
jgi:hypothetical protein